MPESDVTVQLLTPSGELAPSDSAEEFLPYFERLTEDDHRGFLRDMRLTRAFDLEATNLQRQGHLGLWAPSTGQEAAQVGSGRATRPQDHVFPAYREHGVALIRGIDPVDIVRLMRGVTHGGWDPAVGNFHLYTLVIGSQALHATGYAMGVAFDGDVATGDPDRDTAVIAYYGDGATSQGDVSEAFVFAASFQTPQVFFLQNNHWAISVPVATQSRTPLYLRSRGFGVPSTQVDGNDVFASYAVTAKHLDDARNGGGPSFIEALTYRVGAHTSSDDPTKYRTDEELQGWVAKDPIARLEAFLRNQGAPQSLFDGIDEEARDLAADVRRRTIELTSPALPGIFDHVYSDPHPVTTEQREWLERYEASLEGNR
ncbi:thiamine pyrophosphate-dependent dehydrogenase E1 component subunit alpha [Clavibacter michiganensis]|uniref:thiamine pyrophosphate-dependent dehydrogenase E1 component subunit alpha n=1 Tax=Clavibacter michiganensis TaxID=28447 RepID=UPI0026DCF45B|nr:thiamine pyrophosphate-dependent dehydrogenase E1 component subunit alpha [Clavibacter michiganensis]MDO4076631.1 thiamine pyrophosphate-dependent dehydrogenase E1 component subunit alpha [Clavibacter michiganensis]